MTGDFVLGRAPREGRKLERSPEAASFLRACAGLSSTFVSLGNHEWMLDREDLEGIKELGAVPLDNAWTHWRGLCIGGLSPGRIGYYRAFREKSGSGERYPLPPHTRSYGAKAPPETAWLRDYAAQPGFKLLLCHQPEYWARYIRPLPIELTLSGHAHGGQIRLFGRGLYAPGQGLLPRYTAGVYENRLVVSRGLANTTVVPRLCNPTEMVYVQLQEP